MSPFRFQPGVIAFAREALSSLLATAWFLFPVFPLWAQSKLLEWIRISTDKTAFAFERSARPFTPWGFNYDHDETGRLIEDYWENEWAKVEEDFREMKQLGYGVETR